MKRAKQLPEVHGNTPEELALAVHVIPRRTPGFDRTLTLVTEIGEPRGYITHEEARLIANWLRSIEGKL